MLQNDAMIRKKLATAFIQFMRHDVIMQLENHVRAKLSELTQISSTENQCSTMGSYAVRKDFEQTNSQTNTVIQTQKRNRAELVQGSVTVRFHSMYHCSAELYFSIINPFLQLIKFHFRNQQKTGAKAAPNQTIITRSLSKVAASSKPKDGSHIELAPVRNDFSRII